MNRDNWWPVTRPWATEIFKAEYEAASQRMPEPDYGFWLGDWDHRAPATPRLPMGYLKYTPFWPQFSLYQKRDGA